MIRILISTRLGERRWPQSKLAKETNIRPSSINNLYHEIADSITFEQLDKICEVLECDVSDILRWEPGEQKTHRKIKK